MISDHNSEVINHLEKFKHITKKIKCEPKICISAVSYFEFFQKAKTDSTTASDFMNEFPIIETTPYIYLLAAKMKSYLNKKKQSIGDGKLPDLLIAATALSFWGSVLTANANDFSTEFFEEIDTFDITFKDQNQRTKKITVYQLLPDSKKISPDLSQFN